MSVPNGWNGANSTVCIGKLCLDIQYYYIVSYINSPNMVLNCTDTNGASDHKSQVDYGVMNNILILGISQN